MLTTALSRRRRLTASTVYRPCLSAFLLPFGAPPPAPCIRHTAYPLTAGDRHGFLVRFDLARQRLAWCMGKLLCIGLFL